VSAGCDGFGGYRSGPLAVGQYRKALSRRPDAEGIEASLALALENMGLMGEDSPPFAEAARGPKESQT
jgi:hypothetical protein